MTKLLLYPGSFNPVHSGHLGAAKIAESITNLKSIFLVSASNADKGQLNLIDGAKRCKMINDEGYYASICYSALFHEKIVHYSEYGDCIFIVGADTWDRLWDTKYGLDQKELFVHFKNYGVKFIVFPRYGIPIINMPDFMIKSDLVDNYYSGVSSTQIRNSELK